MPNNVKEKHPTLTEKDFYEQACAYFYYHAEQRTTMINYFIAVFAACMALFGSLIVEYPAASMLISFFLIIVSVLFHLIDQRNRFDVKQSQNVIAQIEEDCGCDVPENENEKYAYGVFSNEANIFDFYGFKKRRSVKNADYRELRRLYKTIKRLSKTGVACEDLKIQYEKQLETLLKKNKISKYELEASFESGPIITLSFSIKMLYYSCITISTLGFVFALILTIQKYI